MLVSWSFINAIDWSKSFQVDCGKLCKGCTCSGCRFYISYHTPFPDDIQCVLHWCHLCLIWHGHVSSSGGSRGISVSAGSVGRFPGRLTVRCVNVLISSKSTSTSLSDTTSMKFCSTLRYHFYSFNFLTMQFLALVDSTKSRKTSFELSVRLDDVITEGVLSIGDWVELVPRDDKDFPDTPAG